VLTVSGVSLTAIFSVTSGACLRFSLAGCILLAMSMSTELSTELPPAVPPKGRRLRKRGPSQRPSQSTKTRMITLNHLDRRTNASRRAFELIAALELESWSWRRVALTI
jgi:hypothetical protein